MAFHDELGIDPFSLIPALFATLLSIYNWLKFSKPADIYPGEIINYGYLQSVYHKSRQLMIPIILFNEGAHPGLVTGIKIGFRNEDKIEYLKLEGQAELLKVSVNEARKFNWETFPAVGYQLIQPPFPIVVEAMESTHVNFVSFAPEAHGIIPIGKEATCIIEVSFGRNKTNVTEFPFYLSAEKSITENTFKWYKPIEQ